MTEEETNMSNFTELEAEVAADMARDKMYPWGEPDMRRWAVAFRLSPSRNTNMLDDETMFAWFANVAAMGEVIYANASPLNADGMQAVLDREAVNPEAYFARWRGNNIAQAHQP